MNIILILMKDEEKRDTSHKWMQAATYVKGIFTWLAGIYPPPPPRFL